MTILPISSIPNFPQTIQSMAQANKASTVDKTPTETWPATNSVLANSLLESAGDQRVGGEGSILNELA
jgi:hypothetical protein